MSTKSEVIFNAKKVIEKHALTLDEFVRKEIHNLANPHYRIVVVGKYQVGKSTLINKVFLGDNPLLLVGQGLCTTAVVTEVTHGNSSKLETYAWENSSDGTEKLLNAVNNPTTNDIRSVTVANCQEDRIALSGRLSRVRITAPVESLRPYTLLDTPGIDDPAPELLNNTTYRIIPSADLAIVVVACKQLDEIELKLLRKDLLDDGISRLMVLISYQPESDRDEETRRMIRESIHAQLANFGKENIPVAMYCFDESVDDIYNTVSKIHLLITSFLSENALPGREEKVAFHLRRVLEKLLLESAAKLRSIGMTELERQELNRKVDREVKDFKRKAERVSENIEQDFLNMQKDIDTRVKNKIAKVFVDHKSFLDDSSSLSDLQAKLKSTENTLKTNLSDTVFQLRAEIKQLVEEILEQRHTELDAAYKSWSLFLDSEFNVGQGFLANVPNWAWEIVNVVVLNFLLPLGWITAIIGRIALTKINFDIILLSGVMKSVILHNTEKELVTAEDNVRNDLMKQIREIITTLLGNIQEEIQKSNLEQVEAIRKALSESPDVEVQRNKLEIIKNDLEAAINQL